MRAQWDFTLAHFFNAAIRLFAATALLVLWADFDLPWQPGFTLYLCMGIGPAYFELAAAYRHLQAALADRRVLKENAI